jgi:hypothetical protein
MKSPQSTSRVATNELREPTPSASGTQSGVEAMNDNTLADVTAASAAYLYNCLPEILKLTPSEQYERLRLHFEAALAAYVAYRQEFVLSDN